MKKNSLKSISATLAAIGLSIGTPLVSAIGQPMRDGQDSQSTSESAMGALVKGLAEPLKKAKARNIIVLDLRGPSGQLHPVGKWLADQLSAAIGGGFPKTKIIDRALLISNGEISGTPMDASAIFQKEIHEARLARADVAITGDFAAVSNQIGVSLRVMKSAEPERGFEVTNGLIPISKQIADLTTEAIPPLELEDGVPQGGKCGIGMPDCIHCPSPPGVNRTGVVILKIVVTTDGRPEKIKITKSPDPDLAAVAVQVVQAWRFKPARGFDGNPIAVVIPIQVTFAFR